MILGRGAEHVQSIKVLGIQISKNCYSKKFKVIFNRGSCVSMRSNGIGMEERHQLKTLHADLWRISNRLVRHINLLLFLWTHSASVLYFMLVVSTRVCGSSSSSTTVWSKPLPEGRMRPAGNFCAALEHFNLPCLFCI